MASARLQSFRSFLTEHFSTLAVEIFGEVEGLVEAFYEENKQLRSVLHMVLNPKIKLARIDITPCTGTTTNVREQPVEPNSRPASGISDPLTIQPKDEEIECNISWNLEQQQCPRELNNINIQDVVKKDPEEEQSNLPSTTDLCPMQEYNPNAPTSASAAAFSEESEESEAYSPLFESRVTTSSSTKPQKDHKTSNTKNPKFSSQKTILLTPRILPPSVAAPSDTLTFLSKLHEAFKDYLEEEKPLITKMGLTSNMEWVDGAIGKVHRGDPPSHRPPAPLLKDYKPNDNAAPRPPLPLCHHVLQPVSAPPTLSAREQAHLNGLNVTWEEAHQLEHSTRGCTESVHKLRRMRLTGRFRKICKLKAGRSHAEQLVFKIKKDSLPRKNTQVEEEMKPAAIREYCRHLCVNWSPCGLVVHPNAPWLAAMPDGLVYDPEEKSSFGLLHTKSVTFHNLTECRFLICNDGVLQLKRSHPHHWHIQAQMMVTGTSWCDLLVHSRESMLVQRIYRDKVIIRVMKKKLEEFFFYYYLPSLV